jgi:outer membrane usher protein
MKRALVLAVLLLGCHAPGYAADAHELNEAALEFIVNQMQPGIVLLALRDDSGAVWLSTEGFEALRLNLPQAEPIEHEAKRYLPLAAIEGIRLEIDGRMQRVLVQAPASSFRATELTAAALTNPMVTRAAPGAFLNYQLSARREQDTSEGIAAELGLFGSPGVFTNTVTAQHTEGAMRAVRLESTLRRDFIDSMTTLSIGDAVSDAGSYGNAVRFGGVRWAKNFDLRPDLVTMPLLSSAGTATVPSTIEVFVNGQLVSQQDVPPGPFVIDRLPVVSGTGEVSVVVRDAFGREHVSTSSFYASQALLARGLSQYAIDLGSLRENFGLKSADYDELMAQGTWRRGLTDGITVEGHAELSAGSLRNLGVNGAFRFGRLGVLSLTGAAGSDADGAGWLGGVGFERRGLRSSFVVSTQLASDGYRQLGDSFTPDSRVRSRTLVQSGASFGRAGSLGLALARQTYFEGPARTTVALNHSVNLNGRGMLNLIASRAFGERKLTGAYLIYTLPLDGRRTFSSSLVKSEGTDEGPVALASLIQNPQAGSGTGYRLSAASTADYEAALQHRFASGELDLESTRHAGEVAHAAYLSGAFTLLDGQLSAARSVTGSFAVVDVGDLADVPVYLENQPVTKTNSRGRALLPELRPYEANRVGIDPRDLPIETRVVASELMIAPPFRSGVVARFPVERIRSGSFRLRRSDGSPVPAGAWVEFNGERFPVALDGFVYVTNFDHGLSAHATWKSGRCRFRIEPPPPDEPAPDMGEIVCRDLPGLVDSR